MLASQHASQKPKPQTALGLSAECFGGGIGRSLVVADYSRHDASRIPDIQGVPGILRENRDEYFGRSPAKADRSWNHHQRARPFRRTQTDLLAHAEGH